MPPSKKKKKMAPIPAPAPAPAPIPEVRKAFNVFPIIVTSLIVIVIALFCSGYTNDVISQFGFDTTSEPISLYPSVVKTPFVPRNSTFDLLKDSHNPHFDQKAMQRGYQKYRNPWTVWSPVRELKEETTASVLPKTMQGTTKLNGHFFILGRTRLTFLTSRMLRMEWSDDKEFQNNNTIVFSEREQFLATSTPPHVSVSDENGQGIQLTLETEYIRVIYGKNEEGKHYSVSPPLFDCIEVFLLHDDGYWYPGLQDKRNLGGTVRTLDRTDGPVPLEPGLLSRSGWSFIDDTHSPLLVPDESNQFDRWVEQRDAIQYTDWYLLAYGNDYRSCLQDFIGVAGRIPLPPKYAFGIWWSRWWKYSDTELKELVQSFESNGVPLDNLVIDMDWHQTAYEEMNKGAVDRSGQPLGWTGYSWDYTLFPNPPNFLEWCHEEGLHTTLNLHPAAGVQPHEHCYPEMAKSMGINPTTGMHVPFDIANATFTRNYFDIVIQPLEEQGIDFWWLDYQQLQVTNITNLSPTLWLNHCFFNDMERAGRLLHEKSLRGLIFHRWGGLGSHRYQIGFSGDTSSTWSALDFQIFFTTTAANVGFGYWSHDIGGFMSNQPTQPEMYTRWVQWGALSPIFRTHAWRQEYLERRIWKYPPYYFQCMREAIHLRYSLTPYLYTEARRSYDTGVSMLYPLYYDYPNDDRSYQYGTEGFLGRSLLIAPVTSPASADDILATNQIFLPGSSDETWIEWYSLTSFGGGSYSRLVAIDEIPVYVRAGSILPMMVVDSATKNLQRSSDDPFVLSVFPGPNGASGSYELYEDDGVSTDYRVNRGARTLFESFQHKNVQANTVEWNVNIHSVEGSFIGMSDTRSYLLRLVGVPPPSRVVINGGFVNRAYKSVFSVAEEPYLHWSMSRDPSHNFVGELNRGWYYDYEHFAIIIKTNSVSRNALSTIQIQWADTSDTEWKQHLDLLHRGWVGLKNTISRGFVYWHGGEVENDIQTTHKLSEELSAAPIGKWEAVLSDFLATYHGLIEDMSGSINEFGAQGAEFRRRVINHMKNHAK